MMLQIDRERRDRIQSALAVGLLHLLFAYIFLIGLGADTRARVEDALKLVQLADEPPPPPPKVRPPRAKEHKRKPRPKNPEGAASPANLRNTPTDIAAPPTPIPLPPPISAAPVPGQGTAAAAGATNVRGPGTGAGGQGTGLGAGSQGNGTGGGGGGGGGRRARWISGSIRDSDYPRAAVQSRSSGTVGLRFVVAPNGRVSQCSVTRSSGSPALDSTTCRLIMSRFRYRPALDPDGRPVAETIRGEHEWVLEPEPPPVDVEPDIPD